MCQYVIPLQVEEHLYFRLESQETMRTCKGDSKLATEFGEVSSSGLNLSSPKIIYVEGLDPQTMVLGGN